MAVLQEIVRLLTFRAKTDGVEQTTAAMNDLAAAEGKVVAQTENVSKATLSTENALNRLRMSIDAEFRSQTNLGKATETLARARSQGLIDMAEEARLLELAGGRYNNLGHGAGAATGQVMALTHATRSMIEQIAMGVSPTQALTAQFSHLSYIMSAPGGFGAAFSALAGLLAPIAPLLIGIGVAVGGIVGIFAGLTTKINETAKTQVNFGQVFRATIQVAAESIGHWMKPAIDQFAKWWQQFVDWITPLFKNVVNGIVGAFVFGFNVVKDTWSLLPAAFASIFTKAMNGAIDIVQNGINGITGPINDLLAKVNLPGIPKTDLSGFKGKPSNADTKLGSIIAQDAKDAFGQDYAGDAFGAISAKAQQLALADAAEKAGKAMKAANDNAKLLKNGLKDLGGVTDEVAKSQRDMVNNALGSFSKLSGAFSKLFADNKALAVSTAILNGLQGVSYALGSSPPPWNFINAAAVGVEAAANVANILATNQNSSSMPSSTGGLSAASSAVASQVQQQGVTFVIHGSGTVGVDDIVDQIVQQARDGGYSDLVQVMRAA